MLTLPERWARELANRLAQRAIPCHMATSARERDAIGGLRYQVHIGEQNVPLGEADHARRRIWYPEDDLPGTYHFYAGSPDEMLGCLRVRVWGPGQVPPDLHTFYSMDMLPGVEALTTCDVTKMVVIPKVRGTTAMASLTGYSIYETVRAHQAALMFACCVPGLLHRYRAIGLRTYGGRLRNAPWGLAVQLIGITNDVEHTRRIGSPWYPALRRLQRERRLPADLPVLRKMAEDDRSALTEPDDAAPEIDAFARSGASAFLSALSPAALARVARYAMILDVPPDLVVTRLGVVERELFVVLGGEFVASRDGVDLRHMARGEVFGEIALLSEGGKRRAEVRSITPGRVLVLRRKLLSDLSASEPKIALEIYRALTQQLLGKLMEEPATVQPKAAAREAG
ncbi:MAG: cyclic nucleotide-binding domain-containing protein [Byssovorax sp.]